MAEFGDLLVPLKERRLLVLGILVLGILVLGILVLGILVLGILVLGIRLYLAVPLSSRVD